MEKCIEGAKRLINKQVHDNRVSLFGISFSEYHKSYYWTNENIKGYLDKVDFEGKDNALSVLASGDHIFNLVEKGITNIDTFDTNKLTEYYALGFKNAMILKYSYEEFIQYMQIISSDNISLEYLTELLLSLLPYMDKKYRVFWREIIEYNYKIQKEMGTNLNLFQMLCINLGVIDARICYNNYLSSKENYEEFKNRLMLANITFKEANAYRLEAEFDSTYDFVLLSNILDYFDKYFGKGWSYDCLKLYEKRISSLVKPEGIIFLHYIFDYNSFDRNANLITDSSISQRTLKGEEVVLLPSDYDALDVGMILKRVK